MVRTDLPLQQRAILEVLRDRGEATRDEVTEALGYRRFSLRTHFVALLRLGEVCERRQVRFGTAGSQPGLLSLPGGGR